MSDTLGTTGGDVGNSENITDLRQSLTVYMGCSGFQGVYSLENVESMSSLVMFMTLVIKTWGCMGRLSGNTAIFSVSRMTGLTNDRSEKG